MNAAEIYTALASLPESARAEMDLADAFHELLSADQLDAVHAATLVVTMERDVAWQAEQQASEDARNARHAAA